MHTIWDFIFGNEVFDILEERIVFGLRYELLDRGVVEEDMDIGDEAEGVKF